MSCFSALAAVTYSKDDKQKSEVIPVESDELEQKGYNSPSLGSHFFAQNEPIINLIENWLPLVKVQRRVK